MTDTRPLVIYWNNQPSPYVVDRFNAVADRGSLRFEAWFDNYREADRSWDVAPSTWRFRARIFGTTDSDKTVQRIPTKLLEQIRPDLLISNYDRKHMVLGLLSARPFARRIALRCLPSWPAWDTQSVARIVAKHALFRMVDGAKVPGPDGAAYAERFGLPSDRIWPVTQSVDLSLYSSALDITETRRAELRAQWGLEGCTFVYVGRMWRGKGVDYLLAAYRRVVTQVPNVSLLMVGDGADEVALREQAQGLPRVRWLGFVQSKDLPNVYAASDVLVFPTLGDPNGLVVEEALAAGLPVIATSAAGDIRARVPEAVGYVAAPADVSAIASPMTDLASDATKRRRLGAGGPAWVARAAPGNYARDFDAFVEGVLSAPVRRTVAAGASCALGPVVRTAALHAPPRVDCQLLEPTPR